MHKSDAKKPYFRNSKPPVRQTRHRQPNRPTSSINLGRLADVVGVEVLASSLGVSKRQLLRVIDGFLEARDYEIHIAHRLEEAGLSADWLDQADAKTPPEFVNELRKLASNSSDPAPLRRQNMKRLTAGFSGGVEGLAEALELTESGLQSILDGRLPIDDERFNHLNPRLMAGGFPNGWLDQAQAQAKPEWISKLQSVPDEIGVHEVNHDSSPDAQHPISSKRSAGDEPTIVISDTDASAPAAPSSVVKEPAITPMGSEADSRIPSIQRPEMPAMGKTPVHENAKDRQLDLPIAQELAVRSSAEFDTPSSIQRPGPEMKNTTSTARRAPAEMEDQSSHADKPISDPVPSKSRRTVRRKPAKDQADGTAADGVEQVKSESLEKKVDASLPKRRGRGRAASTEEVPADDEVSARTGAAPVSVSEQPAPTVSVPADGKPSGRQAKSTVARDRSLARAEALDKLLSTARRGAKVTLWRDLLQLSLPYWGNIRRGTLMMRDELAQAVTEKMGLPAGWLDDPEFPPPKLSAWVHDANAPLPGSGGDDRAPDSRSSTTNERADAKPQKASATRKQRSLAKTMRHAAGTSTDAPRDPTPAASYQRLNEPVEPMDAKATASRTEQLASPLQMEDRASSPSTPSKEDVLVAPRVPAFEWTPAPEPRPATEPGALVQAVGLVLNHLALSGRFTDDDALRLMAFLSSGR